MSTGADSKRPHFNDDRQIGGTDEKRRRPNVENVENVENVSNFLRAKVDLRRVDDFHVLLDAVDQRLLRPHRLSRQRKV